MKKTVLLPLLFQCLGLIAQNFYPSAYRSPVTGFELLRQENPIIYALVPSGSQGENWAPSQRILMFKDPVLPFTEEERVSDWESNMWVDNQSTVNSFILDNQNRLQTVYSHSKYSGSGSEWEGKSKFDFAYNSNNQLIQLEYYQAQPETSDNYVRSHIMYIKYDENGNRITDSSFYTSSGSTPYVSRFQYTNGKLSLTEEYSGDQLSSKDTYTYNGNLLTSAISEYFNNTTDEWLMMNADSFEYDAANNISKRVYYGMLFFDGQAIFDGLRNETYSYTSDHKLEHMIERYYSNDEWIPFSKTDIEYDANGKAEVGYQYTPVNGGWNTTADTKYVFDILAGLKPVAQSLTSVQIFPNPANDKLTIDLKEKNGSIRLFDALGKCCYEQTEATDKIDIDISSFKNGVYYALIQSESQQRTEKIIIRH
jgi:hypothetical protein